MINFANPKSEYLKNKKKINNALLKVLNSNNYILGNSVKTFEKNFSKYNKSKFSLGVSSGTDAIIIALKALNIQQGDEVITTSHTAYATVAAIVEVGAKPVFVDINFSDFTIDHTDIENIISNKTKGIILVHLYGNVANVKKIQKICQHYKLFLIEDCAQATGASIGKKKVGTFGDIGTFSFYPTKNLSTFGDAGAIITNNKKLYLKSKLIREYGWIKKNIGEIQSINRRMDEIHASILNIQIKDLDKNNKKRVKIATMYSSLIKNQNVILPILNKKFNNVFHLYVIKVKKKLRSKLITYLKKNKINPGIHYVLANHQQKPFKRYKKTKLVNTNTIIPMILSLPVYPALSTVKVKKIIKIVNSFF